jgi:phosphoribosylcarboxyaminoimidazole (NCAIR) mutase
MSENIEIARRPKRSINPPTIGETKIPGILESAASKPALAADPVSSRTSQGTAIITTPFEIPETAFVACSNGNAALLIAIFSVVLITMFQRN